MKPATTARKALLASLIVSTSIVSSGCSTGGFSLASMNPFSKPAGTTQVGPGPTARMSESIAATAGGARNQLNTIGSTAKSALTKSKDAVAGVFTFGDSDSEISPSDPLSLANKPKSIGAEVFVANGQLWESTGDFKKAMESYGKALASEPSNGPALTSIARLHFREGNHSQAVEYFQRAIEQSPADAGLHNDLGLTLSKVGEHNAATQSLQKALDLAPGTSRYANNLASVKFQHGDSSGAFQVLALNNKPAVAHFNMAYLLFKNGQLNEARTHLVSAMQSEPQSASDSAVQRAVDRSRDMLAQIDTSLGPVAQAGPQALVAGGPLFGKEAAGSAVKQTSQSEVGRAAVAPAASLGPATSNIAPAAKSEAPVTGPAATTNTAVPWAAPSNRPMPIKPTATGAAPSVPFAMPGSFSEAK